jgi:hypothetical protein
MNQMGIYKFPGSLAANLVRNDLKLLEKTNAYRLLVKSDGVRGLIFLTKYENSPQAIFLNRAMQFYSIQVKMKTSGKDLFNGTILDGELVYNTDKLQYEYQIFDCIAFKGEDVKGKNYIERMKYVSDIFMKSLSPDPENSCSCFQFSVKELIQRKSELFKTYPFETDGYILINTSRQYIVGEDLVLFKWKPVDRITFDFKIKWNNNEIKLLVLEHNSLINIFQIPEIFWVMKGYRKEDYDEQIVECVLDSDQKYYPKKIRYDKPSPNSLRTYQQTLLSFNQNVKLEEWISLPGIVPDSKN